MSSFEILNKYQFYEIKKSSNSCPYYFFFIEVVLLYKINLAPEYSSDGDPFISRKQILIHIS